MFTKTIFETAEEVLSAFENGTMPPNVYLVFEGSNSVFLSGDGCNKFDLQGIGQDQIVAFLLKRHGIRVHFT